MTVQNSKEQQNQDSEKEIPEVLEQIETEITAEGEVQDNQAEQLKKLQEALLRSQADYQNLLMRGERDRGDMVYFLSAKILAPLLTQIDNLERAVALKTGVEGDAFVDGVRSVFSGFQKYLESQNVKSFVSIGEGVDPNRHDVMTEMPGEAGKIIQEFEKGYLIADRVLRHAKVVTGSGN